MRFDLVSSGSKGNATLVFSSDAVICLDFGIPKRRVKEALLSYGKKLEDVLGFFITHEHSDHAGHVDALPKEKVYASTLTLPRMEGTLPSTNLLRPFSSVALPPFTVTALPVSHDAKNPVAFLVSDGKESLAYVTDTGFVPEKDFPYLRNLDYYLFESNHDPEMLFHSRRPDSLIRRIISDKGHLNNQDCADYLSILFGPKTKEVVLCHLSEECNTPETALGTFEREMMRQLGYVPGFKVTCASEREETKGGKE